MFLFHFILNVCVYACVYSGMCVYTCTCFYMYMLLYVWLHVCTGVDLSKIVGRTKIWGEGGNN